MTGGSIFKFVIGNGKKWSLRKHVTKYVMNLYNMFTYLCFFLKNKNSIITPFCLCKGQTLHFEDPHKISVNFFIFIFYLPDIFEGVSQDCYWEYL